MTFLDAPPQFRTTQSAFPISPASMGSIRDGRFASPGDSAGQDQPGRRRRPSSSAANAMDAHHEKSDRPGDDQNDVSSDDEGPVRKRRRSRKGLEKRFECTAEGCGKSYSRAEHLYRHQLNHNSKQIFRCEYPDCPRTFVRGDLLKRHMDRHTAKGSQLNRRDSLASHAASLASPILAPADASRTGTAFNNDARPPQTHHISPQEPAANPYSPLTHTPPVTFPTGTHSVGHDVFSHDPSYAGSVISHREPQGQSSSGLTRPSVQTNVGPYGVMSPVSSQQGYHTQSSSTPQTAGFVSQHNVLPFNLPPAQYSHFEASTTPREEPQSCVTTSAEYTEATHAHATEMAMLDHIAMSGSGPVFGDDGVNKSPYVGMPEDFMAYLFNSLPQHSSPHTPLLPPPVLNYGNLHNNQYSASYLGDGTSMGLFHPDPQHVMAVNNLLDQDVPEANITDERSQEIFDFICKRFQENEHDDTSKYTRDSIIGGDRTAGDHMLSRRMMQAYICSYWYHFSDQMPILHKPTFSSDKTPNLLLLAIMAIGAACLDRTHGAKVTMAGAKVSNFLAEHLRWAIFRDSNFSPPAKLWVFQTLILLELYEKMYSTRELHERAHIHHATTITLMRRGRSLIGKPSLDSPPHPHDGGDGSRKSSACGSSQTPDEWWNRWITDEATRRAAFAAFVIDSTHATMFGHSAVMVAHEMRLPLPCDESLWRAASSAEVARVEDKLVHNRIKPVSFLEGLKRTLNHEEVHTTSFGRAVIMAGLLSVTYHMHQRDLQINVLGGGIIQSLGGRDKWRASLTRAYDSWKTDFDRALGQDKPSFDPYRHDMAKPESNIAFESRTVLHHLAHMAMHADIVDCQMFARAKRLLGRSIGPQEFNSAQRRIKEFWAPSARARDATYYALKFLCSVLAPDLAGLPYSASLHQNTPYETRDDVLLNRPWVLYFAALVVWCYGFAVEGPCPSAAMPASHEEKWQQMRGYFSRYGSITDPNELRNMRGINNNTAVLMVLQDTFNNSRWELLHEGANLLHNCIVLNCGGNIL